VTLPGARRRLGSLSLLVVGDLMLDEDVEGEMQGMAPAGPAKILSVGRRTQAPGGAANVAANVTALGARAMVCGAIGADREGATLRSELARLGVELLALVQDGRPTTVKTRVLDGRRLVLRMDRERRWPLVYPAAQVVVDRSSERIGDVDAVVISDYQKGVVTRDICSTLIPVATARGIPVVVNTKSERLDSFRGAALVSLSEDGAARAGATSDPELDALAAEMGDTALLVTRAERGMALWRSGRSPLELAAMSDGAVDVTGAGDTVCAAIAVALAAGCALDESIRFANAAAAIAVERPGTTAVLGPEVIGRLA
jgi:D-beta-D-heptose 7-phosphate kinase / D-beta-D-heptose 1-phosphate adenosyltransferase